MFSSILLMNLKVIILIETKQFLNAFWMFWSEYTILLITLVNQSESYVFLRTYWPQIYVPHPPKIKEFTLDSPNHIFGIGRNSIFLVGCIKKLRATLWSSTFHDLSETVEYLLNIYVGIKLQSTKYFENLTAFENVSLHSIKVWHNRYMSNRQLQII